MSPLSPHAMIPVLHLAVLGSGPNRALIMLSRALPCCCLSACGVSLLSVDRSATPSLYSPHAAKSVTARLPGHCASTECQHWRTCDNTDHYTGWRLGAEWRNDSSRRGNSEGVRHDVVFSQPGHTENCVRDMSLT